MPTEARLRLPEMSQATPDTDNVLLFIDRLLFRSKSISDAARCHFWKVSAGTPGFILSEAGRILFRNVIICNILEQFGAKI